MLSTLRYYLLWMDSTRMVITEEQAGSVKKQTPALTEYLLPQHVLYERVGVGFVVGSVYGFASRQAEGVSDLPWGTQLRHRIRAGQCSGSKFAWYPPVLACMEHAVGTWRGKRDLLNTFVGGTVAAGIFTCGIIGHRPIVASTISLALGSWITLAEYGAQCAGVRPPWKAELERAAPISHQTSEA